MPYKFNEPRCHKIPTAKYRVTNWPDYDAALVQRGALTVWFTDEAIAEWRAPATGRRGGQLIYSALAIETALTIRLVFHQPLRQTEGLLRSIADVLGADIVRRQFGDHNVKRLGVDAKVQLTPAPARSTASLRVQPFAFAVDFETGAVHDQVQRLCPMNVSWQDCQADTATTEGRMIWDGDVDAEHIGNGS